MGHLRLLLFFILELVSNKKFDKKQVKNSSIMVTILSVLLGFSLWSNYKLFKKTNVWYNAYVSVLKRTDVVHVRDEELHNANKVYYTIVSRTINEDKKILKENITNNSANDYCKSLLSDIQNESHLLEKTNSSINNFIKKNIVVKGNTTSSNAPIPTSPSDTPKPEDIPKTK